MRGEPEGRGDGKKPIANFFKKKGPSISLAGWQRNQHCQLISKDIGKNASVKRRIGRELASINCGETLKETLSETLLERASNLEILSVVGRGEKLHRH